MGTLFIAIGAAVAFIVAYHTYGRWLGQRVFRLSAQTICPSCRLNDGVDYVPTSKAVVFGHHFTSIAGTGPIVGPAIAIMWGWLPALLWVILGSIFIGAVHDFGALVVSLRNNGQTVGDVAGRVLNRRVRLLFLFVLFMSLTIVLAIFGLVIAAVFKQYPAVIFPCTVQIPIAVAIGLWLHRKGVGLLIPSLLALAVMYLTVIYGDQGMLHSINTNMAGWSIMTWVVILLAYSYVASVLPVWTLLQPRDYINSLQLITALGLIMVGLVCAAFIGGAPPVQGASRPPLEIVAPMWQFNPTDGPVIFPFLFITIACGAISGFHCLVSSGTSSKQLATETDARFVGFGSMLTEGFLATLVILACVAGIGLGVPLKMGAQYVGRLGAEADIVGPDGQPSVLGSRDAIKGPEAWLVRGKLYDRLPNGPVTAYAESPDGNLLLPNVAAIYLDSRNSTILADENYIVPDKPIFNNEALSVALIGRSAWNTQYASWTAAGGLGAKVGAFVNGSANFLKAMGVPGGVAVALMGVLVASFAGTTLDTACRLQRYVVQELAATFAPRVSSTACAACGYDLNFNVSGACPECGKPTQESHHEQQKKIDRGRSIATANPATWLTNKHTATIFAVVVAAIIATLPLPGQAWSLAQAGKGGMILWPMFGATNQLLAGLSFLVITFYLWRRGRPVWFLVIPMIFMLIMPLWAMTMQLFVGFGTTKSWWASGNWVLISIGLTTIALELWMIVEAVLLLPKVKGVLEFSDNASSPVDAATVTADSGARTGGGAGGMQC